MLIKLGSIWNSEIHKSRLVYIAKHLIWCKQKIYFQFFANECDVESENQRKICKRCAWKKIAFLFKMKKKEEKEKNSSPFSPKNIKNFIRSLSSSHHKIYTKIESQVRNNMEGK